MKKPKKWLKNKRRLLPRFIKKIENMRRLPKRWKNREISWLKKRKLKQL